MPEDKQMIMAFTLDENPLRFCWFHDQATREKICPVCQERTRLLTHEVWCHCCNKWGIPDVHNRCRKCEKILFEKAVLDNRWNQKKHPMTREERKWR